MALFNDVGSKIAAVIQQAGATIIQAQQFQQRLALEREQLAQQSARQAEVFKMQQDKFALEQELFKLDVSKQRRLQQEADVATARTALEMTKTEMEAYEREAARRDGADPDFQGYNTMRDLADYVSRGENSLSAERSRSFGETVNTPDYQARQAALDRAKIEQRNRAAWLKSNRPASAKAPDPVENELTRLATGGGAPKPQEANPAAVGDPIAMGANIDAFTKSNDFAPIYRDLEAAGRRNRDAASALSAAYSNVFPGGRLALLNAIKAHRNKAK